MIRNEIFKLIIATNRLTLIRVTHTTVADAVRERTRVTSAMTESAVTENDLDPVTENLIVLKVKETTRTIAVKLERGMSL